ncbi:11300_t:CDS:2 [Entrophospora sp. SA101]|nr:9779_t:CDS:2 [Entrophospora sp. SA101]CAJ0768031.1 11300_t:CDS:2 [Entrophospora sp. SA101]CAJ0904594.1 5689_t:CDS:2 [Entrophospora sp. SA101]CAJ0913428.1 18909_t:CDS:2 [Entrophospora sp. SA101]CAJ0913436.1 18913_t:CDS:2 [Entrophospora sp. SA101]
MNQPNTSTSATITDDDLTNSFYQIMQILAAERNQNATLNVPTYSNIEAPPSIFPQKKYCDLTGLEVNIVFL